MPQSANLSRQLSELCTLLTPYQFGIGGSCLLHHLGLDVQPGDIDIVCTEAHFSAIADVLHAQGYQLQIVPPHPDYASAHFARFSRADSHNIDLMAGIAVRQHGGIRQWSFNPQRCHWQNGICWMPPADWLQLYQLFNRPQRVAQLKRHLIALRLNSLSAN
jgi:hypothetical protein